MPYPDFLCIGAQKSGTTWLARVLGRHPEVWMPPFKELHYFDWCRDDERSLPELYRDRLFGERYVDRLWRRRVRGLPERLRRNSAPGRGVWYLKYLLPPPSDRWYSSLFCGEAGQVHGEATPNYGPLERERIGRLHELMPGVRLVYLMRNPIERHYSALNMAKGRRAVRELAVGVRAGEVEDASLRLHSDYERVLDTWSEFFGKDRIFCGFVEDIHFRPEEFLNAVYSFLEVGPREPPKLAQKKVHARGADRMPSKTARALALVYAGKVSSLSERFGGYADFWRFCSEAILDGYPEGSETVSYPFHESGLWERWLLSGKEKNGLRSGTLREIEKRAR
ncbi:Sulfotransferase family [Rubrobacter radiotolerans]|uniref:Sulfotransferase n=1 Tax=Rubrobacter radiotolerans TaxID=42256 RepID=A0A023X4V6_RUBRA|nr:sulfotransferase [Rubrobacter radiotolerans]AHY47256.1 Sulfotransferase family [Rubrobacter radiotolerans]MDX5894661.1 sulfotransferase [Rubrobacter radiotolerans]SMC06494.1 Sulfotransferase family protein [Rubrobacter radiotolerans DSM 5868]